MEYIRNKLKWILTVYLLKLSEGADLAVDQRDRNSIRHCSATAVELFIEMKHAPNFPE